MNMVWCVYHMTVLESTLHSMVSKLYIFPCATTHYTLHMHSTYNTTYNNLHFTQKYTELQDLSTVASTLWPQETLN